MGYTYLMATMGKRGSINPEDVLTERESETLTRAQIGILHCPWCGGPLTGSFYYLAVAGRQISGVRLHCANCGFDES